MSLGQGQGRNRATRAAEEAIAGGLLNVSIRGAQRVLFNISGGEDMTLFEVNEVAELIGGAIYDGADITFGAVIDPSLNDMIRVTLIAAGMPEARTAQVPAMHLEQPQQRPSGGGYGFSGRARPCPRPGLSSRSRVPSRPRPRATRCRCPCRLRRRCRQQPRAVARSRSRWRSSRKGQPVALATGPRRRAALSAAWTICAVCAAWAAVRMPNTAKKRTRSKCRRFCADMSRDGSSEKGRRGEKSSAFLTPAPLL